MSKRPPSTPPLLPGFVVGGLLGSGGFADVFAYEQHLPKRDVAVKVFVTAKLGDATIENFTSEANLMAKIGDHPNIVSIYHAGIADDGRPYLVMENCSRPNLQKRYRQELLTESETLQIGVQIASAVETAHRAQILHRDIKPANILVTRRGQPVLTDFGIAATTGGHIEYMGLSTLWAPPEVLDNPANSGITSDVYSLAATLYALLAGRSPFELASASNRDTDIMGRIQTMPLPALGRGDVSEATFHVLRRAMAKRPSDRYESMMQFARALQHVEIGLGFPGTNIDVLDDDVSGQIVEQDDEGARTRIKGFTSIDAQRDLGSTGYPTVNGAPTPAALPQPAVPEVDLTQVRAAPPVGQAVLHPSPPQPGVGGLPYSAPPTPTRGRAKRGAIWAVSVVAALAVAGGVGLWFVNSGLDEGQVAAPVQTQQIAPVDAVRAPEAVLIEDLVGTRSGSSVEFTWVNPDEAAGDTYLWRTVALSSAGEFATVSETNVVVPAEEGKEVCIEVLLRRADGTSSDAGVTACAS